MLSFRGAVIPYGEFRYKANEREAFRRGELAPLWAAAHPTLFDADDLRLARSQPSNHFFEWLAAIRIFQDTGFVSLIEKYQFKRHERKYAVFTNLVPQPVVALFASRYLGSHQAPDLLCYARDMGDWFFCEVKGGTDRVRGSQSRDFAILERMSGRPVRLISFRERLPRQGKEAEADAS